MPSRHPALYGVRQQREREERVMKLILEILTFLWLILASAWDTVTQPSGHGYEEENI